MSATIVNVREITAKTRTAVVLKYLMAGACFIGLFILLHDFGSIAQFFLAGGSFCIVLAVLLLARQTRPIITFACPSCGKQHRSSSKWRCGYCQHINKPFWMTGEPSIVDGCSGKNCGTAPKAYLCDNDRCGMPIYFDADCNGQFAATSTTKSIAGEGMSANPASDELSDYERHSKDLDEAKRLKEQTLSITQKKIELARAERKLEEEQRLLNKMRSNEFWGTHETPPIDTAEALREYEKDAHAWSKEAARINADDRYDDETKADLLEFGQQIFNARREAKKETILKRTHSRGG